MKTTRYEQDFHSFVTFYTNVVSAKNAFECFCLLNNISKDTAVDGLSESGFNFFGHEDIRRLEENY